MTVFTEGRALHGEGQRGTGGRLCLKCEMDLSTIRTTDRLKGLVVALIVGHFWEYLGERGEACLEMRERWSDKPASQKISTHLFNLRLSCKHPCLASATGMHPLNPTCPKCLKLVYAAEQVQLDLIFLTFSYFFYIDYGSRSQGTMSCRLIFAFSHISCAVISQSQHILTIITSLHSQPIY